MNFLVSWRFPEIIITSALQQAQRQLNFSDLLDVKCTIEKKKALWEIKVACQMRRTCSLMGTFVNACACFKNYLEES